MSANASSTPRATSFLAISMTAWSASTPTPSQFPRRIGIAGGESKHKAIHAAVSGGWVNVLITDTGIAAALLQR